MKHIKINVYPDAGKEAIIQKDETSYEVFVGAPAQNGEANKRMLLLLQKEFPDCSLRIVSGTRSPHKIIEVSER